MAFAVEGDGVGFATESYAASALYTTLASLSAALWRIRRAKDGPVSRAPYAPASAQALGVSVKTLRNWEQRRRRPTGPALVLLALVQREPLFVAYVLESRLKTPTA